MFFVPRGLSRGQAGPMSVILKSVPVAMNRVAVLYLGSVVVFFVGIWLTLQMGSKFLNAPPDISGQWQSPDNSGRQITIQQSGRFLELTTDAGKHLDLILNASSSNLSLTGDGWTVQAKRTDSQHLNLQFSAPSGEESPPSGDYQSPHSDPTPSTEPSIHAGN
jgi:hypothetical protein